jgi:plasmid stability protein
MEAEVRDILKNALKPGQRLQMGNAIAELGSRLGLTKDDFAAFELARNDTPAEPMNFE